MPWPIATLVMLDRYRRAVSAMRASYALKASKKRVNRTLWSLDFNFSRETKLTAAELTHLTKWFLRSVEKHALAKAAGRESEIVAGMKLAIENIESVERIAGDELKKITIHNID